MSTSTDAPEAPGRSSQLNGWKEIAAYLGRSVRTVQRWEKDFGLPVRRFGASKPESVFALLHEIDAWLLTSQGVNARSGNGAGAESPARADARAPGRAASADRTREPLFPRGWFLRMVLVAVGAVLILVALWAVWMSRQTAGEMDAPQGLSSSGAAPATWRVDLDTLVVSDARGTELWRHRFPRELVAQAYDDAAAGQNMLVAGITDIEGDGSREVWFISKAHGAPAGSALHRFNSDGTIRWTFEPELTMYFGAETFGPSWIVDRAFVTADPAGGPGKAIWAVLFDTALFPSSIMRIDLATGTPLTAYWTAGSITSAALDMSGPEPRLLVGACHNETRAGSLSVLDALNPTGSAPAEVDKYRCASCPPGAPLDFLVFPKPARFAQLEATGPVETLTPQADGTLGVRVRYAVADPESFAVGIFTLDPSLTPVSADTADDYLTKYGKLDARGAAPAGAPA
ncbi:MAG TPA: hypothetical protein VLN08_15205, partial [Vicinamibacterales bacterium]|nr:hypothetical protein [Vicinamibacterales bacterium]